jgi:hypothetical protein
MPRKIEVNKTISIKKLNEKLSKIPQKEPIDLDKYFGKIKFGIDGLEYQLMIRNKSSNI